MSGHTPTPWRAIEGETSIWQDINPEDLSSYGLGILVAETPAPLHFQRGKPSYEERIANAAFIARAVNCHDELVEALDRLVDAISDMGYSHSNYPHHAMKFAQAALAKAEAPC